MKDLGDLEAASRLCEDAIGFYCNHAPSLFLLSEICLNRGNESRGLFIKQLAEDSNKLPIPEDDTNKSRDVGEKQSLTRIAEGSIPAPLKSSFSETMVSINSSHPFKNERIMDMGKSNAGNEEKAELLSCPTLPIYKFENIKSQIDQNRFDFHSLPSAFSLSIDGLAPILQSDITDKDVKNVLKQTWVPFYGNFQELREVQKLSTFPILNGCDVLITSSTSSGKTEAVMAPVIERMMNNKWKGLSIIYISPTKALANNISDRLNNPLNRQLGIDVGLYTGDNHDANFTRCKVLITTPESIDSLLVRQPVIFLNVRTIIIDEIHLLDGDYRGDQLRILLKRIRRIEGVEFNIIGLSATINCPEEVFARYSKDLGRKIISVGGRKNHLCHFVPSHVSSVQLIKRLNFSKGIIFCNSRKSVERSARVFSKIMGSEYVFAHHGSLGREPREKVELMMNNNKVGFVVATTTLEIGIDIGDLDVVIISEIPWSTSSLAQRIGRACRKSDTVNVIFICKTTDEIFSTIQMLDYMIQSKYYIKNYKFDASVLVQQILSITAFKSKSGTSKDDFFEILGEFADSEDIEAILSHLIKIKFIEMKNDLLFLSKNPESIHSNVPRNQAIDVIEKDTKKIIGQIVYPVDDHFILEGKCWKVLRREERCVIVQHSGLESYEVNFSEHQTNGAFFEYLPEYIKKRQDPDCGNN